MLLVRFAVSIALFAAVLLPFLSAKRAILWSIGLGSAMALAIGAFRQWSAAHHHIRLVDNASGLVEPRDGQLVAVCGAVEAEGEPLRSPLFDEPSVAYQYAIHHTVYKWRPQSRSTSSSEVRDYVGYGAVPMSVRGQYFTARLGGFPLIHEFPKHDDSGGWLLELAASAADSAEPGDSPAQRVAALAEVDKERLHAQQSRVRDYVRSARFDTLPPDEMLEYVEWWHKDWDGEQRVAKNYRREAGFEPHGFWEQRVAPWQPVCAIGVWSDARRAVVHEGDRELQLYPGTPLDVKSVFARHAGAGLFVALLLGAGSVLVAVYLIRGGW